MNWYKMSNGNLVNLGLATGILAVESRDPENGRYYKVAVFFPDHDSISFPEVYPTRKDAVAFIDSIYQSFAV